MLDLSAIFTTFPVLQTERLVLRAVRPDDAADMFRIMGDPRVTRYFGSTPMGSVDEAAQRIGRIMLAWQEQTGVRWAITQRERGQLLGTCGYWRLVKPHFWAEIGYELAPESWGQGIMTETVGAVLQFGFTTLGLHRVEAQIHPANIGSRRVLEKLGFVQEGYFRENYYEVTEAQFTDTAVFSLLQSTWMRRKDAWSHEIAG
jgi:ribosomal-protein-alanine N-acetyltransferase